MSSTKFRTRVQRKVSDTRVRLAGALTREVHEPNSSRDHQRARRASEREALKEERRQREETSPRPNVPEDSGERDGGDDARE